MHLNKDENRMKIRSYVYVQIVHPAMAEGNMSSGLLKNYQGLWLRECCSVA